MSDDPKEKKNLDRLLRNAVALVTELSEALTEAKPKAEAYDDLMDSEGTCTLMRAAKIVDFPEGNSGIYRYLVEKGDIYSKINHDLYPAKREYFPSEDARRKGYYVVDVGFVEQGDKKIATHVTKVTAEGLDHLHRLIKKDFDLEDDG